MQIGGRRGEDFDRGVNDDGLIATDAARHLLWFIKQETHLKSVSGPYLALAAGNGKSEIKLAEMLGIPLSEITLVDQNVDLIPPELESHQYIKDDLFHYLSHTQHTDFGLVAIFGAEYAFRRKDQTEKLWNGLSRVVRKNGYILIAPKPDYYFPPSGFTIVTEAGKVIAVKK